MARLMMRTMILTMQNPAPTKPQAPMVSGGRDVVVVDVDGEGEEEMAVEMRPHRRKPRLNNRR